MIGKLIADRYRITEKLGQGAMGQVWKADDTRLGREVALKFLPEVLVSSPNDRRRFLRGTKAASKLDHPNLATVYDADEIDGQIYVANQFVDGETVRQRVRKGSVPLQECVHIIKGAAMALGAAHDAGVLHRDISSGNVMIEKGGEGILVDFGLALSKQSSRMTETQGLIGTVGYLAPEVLKQEEGDARSDLFGLGVVLYELVAGRLPFGGDRDEVVLYSTVHSQAKDPSEIRPDCPLELDRVLEKALEKQPVRRYQNATELAQDLERLEQSGVLAHSDELADSEQTGGQFVVWLKRRAHRIRQRITRIPAAAKAAGIAVLLVGAFLSYARLSHTWPFVPATPSFASLAVIPLEDQSFDSDQGDYLSRAVAKDLSEKLEKVLSPDTKVTPWETTRNFSRRWTPEEVMEELNVEAALAGKFEVRDDSIRVTLDLFEKDIERPTWQQSFVGNLDELFALEKEINIAAAVMLKGQLTKEDIKEISAQPTNSLEAYRFCTQADAIVFEEDLDALPDAVQLYEKAIALDDDYAQAYLGLGAVQNMTDWYVVGEGENLTVLAKINFRHALRLDPNLDAARRGLIRIYWEQGLTEEILKLGKSIPGTGEDDPGRLYLQGMAYTFGRLPEKAIPVLKQLLQIQPDNEGALWTLLLAYRWSDEHQNMILSGERFLELYGDDAEVLYSMAMAHEQTGNVELAKAYYFRAIEMGDKTNIDTFHRCGVLLARTGDQSRARELWVQGLEIIDERLSVNPNDLGRARAIFLALLGRCSESRDVAATAVRKRKEQNRPEYSAGLALAYLYCGDFARAADHIEGSLEQDGVIGGMDYLHFILRDGLDVEARANGGVRFLEALQEAKDRRAQLAEAY